MELKIGVFADEQVIHMLKRIFMSIARMLKLHYASYKVALADCEIPLAIFIFSTARISQSASIYPLDLLALGQTLLKADCKNLLRNLQSQGVIIVPQDMRTRSYVAPDGYSRIIVFDTYPQEFVAYILLFVSSVLGLKRSLIIRSLKSLNLHNVSGLVETLKQVSISERLKRS